MPIYFKNKGVIDIDAVKTMGASIKSEDAIGYFGTGLKFAIATLLREGQEIDIWAGLQHLRLGTKTITIRDKEFQVVTLNDEQLGFTTELGKNWKMWMAFREFYCNAKDEGGDVHRCDYMEPEADSTLFRVAGAKIDLEYVMRSENFVLTEPLWADEQAEVHSGERDCIFYKGVRVHDTGKRTAYTYNIRTKVDLTEDRTLKYSWDLTAICKTVQRLQDKEMLRRILLQGQGSFEHDELSYKEAYNTSQEFKDVAVELYKKNCNGISPSLRKFVRDMSPGNLYEPAALSRVQQSQLNKAIAFCQFLGYDATDYKIIVVETLGPSAMAKALRKSEEIIVSKQCFDQGTKYLASTLLEEVIHLREGLDDETRSMQTYLFNKIISLGEELQGEAL